MGVALNQLICDLRADFIIRSSCQQTAVFVVILAEKWSSQTGLAILLAMGLQAIRCVWMQLVHISSC